MAIYELAFQGHINDLNSVKPVVRVYGTSDYTHESPHFYNGQNLTEIIKEIRKKEGPFDGYLAGTSITTVPALKIVSWIFEKPATLEQLAEFYHALSEDSEKRHDQLLPSH